jgi:hypothetical protein
VEDRCSGQQLSEENFTRLSAWMTSKKDGDIRSLAFEGVLSGTNIAAECGFAKSSSTLGR